MTEKGGVVGPLYDDGHSIAPYRVLALGSLPSWEIDGAPLRYGDLTKAHYGPLTHRVNPDGTPYKEAIVIDLRDEKIKQLLKEVAALKRLSLSMYKAKSLREAIAIYDKKVGVK